MTLVVDGADADFQSDVLRWLSEICPCEKLSLEAGIVVLGTRKCCCSRQLGCSLVTTLVDAEGDCGTITIVKDACGSFYTDLTVHLCVGQQLPSCSGKPPAPVAVTLAHELIHALLACEPNLPGSSPYPPEVVVSCAENQIRSEMGLPRRCFYGGDEVPSGCGWLPDRWEPDPSCSGYRVFWCALKSLPVRIERTVDDLFKMARRLPRRAPSSGDFWEWRDPPDLDQRLARGHWVTEREPNAKRSARWVADLATEPGFSGYVMMEEIKFGFPYLVTIMYVLDGRIEVVTNGRANRTPWPTSAPSLVRVRAPAGGSDRPSTDATEVRLAIEGLPLVGGRASVEDGILRILTTELRGADLKSTALYGIPLLVDDPGAAPPDDVDDRLIWAAMNSFYDLREERLREGAAGSIEPLD